MFCSQFVQAFLRRGQSGRVELAGQGNRREHTAPVRFDVALEVRQRSTHADEVINKYVVAASHHGAVECRLPRQPQESAGAGMAHHIGLDHVAINGPARHAPQEVGKHFGNGIDTFALQCVGADQRWRPASSLRDQCQGFLSVERVGHERRRRIVIARLCSPVRRVLFHRRFAGVNQHVWESAPRCAGWLRQVRHDADFHMHAFRMDSHALEC